MAAQFRDFLQRLIERGELRRVSEEVDLRQLSARVRDVESGVNVSDHGRRPTGGVWPTDRGRGDPEEIG